MRTTRYLFVLVLFFITIFGCDERTVEVEEYTIDTVTVSPDTIVIVPGNTQSDSKIVATIMDEDDFPVENENVRFETNLGKLLHLGARVGDIYQNVMTDENGEADVYLYEQDVAGMAQIDIAVYGDSQTVHVMIVNPE